MPCSSTRALKKAEPAPTVMITGAGQRIGLCIAKTLLRRGFSVVAMTRTESPELLEFQKSYPQNLVVLQADLETEVFNAEFWSSFQKNHGALYAFIHSASTFLDDTAMTATPELCQTQQRVNKDAFVEAAYSYYQFMKNGAFTKTVPASFIALLDQKVERLNPTHFSYTLSKLQLAASIPYLAQTLSPWVRVNAVSPGLTLPSGNQSVEQFTEAQEAFPFGYGPNPMDITKTLEFVMAQRCLVGQILTVDAGQHLMADEDIVGRPEKIRIQYY